MPTGWSGGAQSLHLLADLLEAQPQSPFPTQDLLSNPRFLAPKLVPPTDLSTVRSLTAHFRFHLTGCLYNSGMSLKLLNPQTPTVSSLLYQLLRATTTLMQILTRSTASGALGKAPTFSEPLCPPL